MTSVQAGPSGQLKIASNCQRCPWGGDDPKGTSNHQRLLLAPSNLGKPKRETRRSKRAC